MGTVDNLKMCSSPITNDPNHDLILTNAAC